MAGEQVDQIINKMNGTGGQPETDNRTENSQNGRLFFCDAKRQEQLNEFVTDEKPKLVVLVGFEGYGKSTFIGALYQQMIQNQVYGDYSLVDSETYVGFERRVFLRRENSENTSDTKRNILGENDMLDMLLLSEKGEKHRILISDKAGETYRKYISSDGEIEKDIVIENADMILFIVDAEADSKLLIDHNSIVQKYESLLDRLKTQGKIAENCSYSIVFTKCDKVTTEEGRKKLVERKDKVCAKFTELVGLAPQAAYEVNSTDLENDELNKVFTQILKPKANAEALPEYDWVKMEIEKYK